MPNISPRDLAYLRRKTLDRDSWAGVTMEYAEVNDEESTWDPVRKESDEDIGQLIYYDPVQLEGFIEVRRPQGPYGGIDPAFGVEHEVTIAFGREKLDDLEIQPKAKDLIRVPIGDDDHAIYEVTQVIKDRMIKHAAFALNVLIEVHRSPEADNSDIPWNL